MLVSRLLSALHARYESTTLKRFSPSHPRIFKLAELTKHYDIGLTIDAEEVDRLEISLKIIEKLALEKSLWLASAGLSVTNLFKTRCVDWLSI